MILLYLLFAGLEFPLEMKYEVVTVEKHISLEAEDHFFIAPTAACSQGASLFLLDTRSLEIWKYDHQRNHFFFFAHQGSGPGELRKNITGFYVLNDELVVLNANGARLDSFSTEDGELRDSRQTRKVLYYQYKNTLISQSSGKFHMENELKSSVEVEGFPVKHYGVQTHSALFKNSYFLIAETMSNNGTIPYVIFDIKGGKVFQNQLEKRQKITENNLPIKIKNELSGMDFNELFFNNFQVVLTQPEYGFVIHEYGLSLYESPTQGHYSVIHTINPETLQQSTLTLYHKGIKNISFIIPQMNGNWIAYNTDRHELIFIRVKKLS